MSRLYTLSEAAAARRRFPLYLVDSVDGLTPEVSEAGGQPQISKVGGAWANTSATLTAVGNGHYYVELTAAELDTLGYFAIRFKSAATAEFNMDGQVILFDLFTSVTQTGDSFARLGAPSGASISADLLVIDNLVDDLESRLGTPSNLGSGATVAANLADIEAQTDDIGAAGAGLTAVPWNATWDAEVQSEVADALDVAIPAMPTANSINERVKAIDDKLPTGTISDLTTAQVNTEVLDVLNVDTFAEPGQENPPATATLQKKIAYLYKFLRNKLVQTSTTSEIYNDAGTIVDHKATVSDSGLVFTRGEFGTGP